MCGRHQRARTASDLIRKVMDHVFDGSAGRLVAHLLEGKGLDRRDRDEIRKLLEAFDAREAGSRRGDSTMSQPDADGFTVLDRRGLDDVSFLLDWSGSVFPVSGGGALRGARPEARYAFALGILAAMAVAPAATFAWAYEPSPRFAPIPTLSASTELQAEWTVVERHSRPTLEAQSPMPAWTRGQWQPLVDGRAPVPLIWLAGSPVTFTLLACGLIGAERYKRQSRMIGSGEIPLLCRSLTRALRISRRVAVGVCDQLAAPVLIGI